MAMFLFPQVSLLWDDLEGQDCSDVLLTGFKCFKEFLQCFNLWLQGEDVDSRELAEVTQSLATRIYLLTYNAVVYMIQLSCALVVYVFSSAETINDAYEYMIPSYRNPVYKSVTSLILYEKPISFDYNPVHWVMKIGKLLLFVTRLKCCSDAEESCLPLGKISILVVLTFLFFHSYYGRQKNHKNLEKLEDGTENELTRPVSIEGNLKWERGVVNANNELQDDQLSLKIYMTPNIFSENQRFNYEDSISSSAASICKIVSDVLLSSNPENAEAENEEI